MENSKTFNLKSGRRVSYEGRSFIRGSNYMALTGKISVFLVSGRLWEVVAHQVSTVVIGVIMSVFFA